MEGKGRIWLVPRGIDGQLDGEPIELGATMVRGWGEDMGLNGGLQGAQTGAEGSTGQDGGGWPRGVYRTTFKLDLDEEAQIQLISAVTGWTLEQVRDWKQWATELRWLERVLGSEWALT